MRKLTLDLATLDVQSFLVAVGEEGGGTVRGRDSSGRETDFTGCESCIVGCQPTDLGTCAPACGVTSLFSCRGEQSCVTCYDPQCEEPY
jgi:hypothetical protein